MISDVEKVRHILEIPNPNLSASQMIKELLLVIPKEDKRAQRFLKSLRAQDRVKTLNSRQMEVLQRIYEDKMY